MKLSIKELCFDTINKALDSICDWFNHNNLFLSIIWLLLLSILLLILVILYQPVRIAVLLTVGVIVGSLTFWFVLLATISSISTVFHKIVEYFGINI